MCHDFDCYHDLVVLGFLDFVRQFWSPWPNHQLVWLFDIKVTCFVWQWLAGDATHEKNIRLSRDSIFSREAGKIPAKYNCLVQLWCPLMKTAIGKVNDDPYYCAIKLVVVLWSKFHFFKTPENAVSVLICLCKIFCSPC